MTEEIQTRFRPNYLAIIIVAIITATILIILWIDVVNTEKKIAELKEEQLNMCIENGIFPCTIEEIVRRDLER